MHIKAPRYVDHFVDRLGTVRCYFRRSRETPRVTMQNTMLGSPAFMAEYFALLNGTALPTIAEVVPVAATPERCFQKLADGYFASIPFGDLSPRTQANHRAAINSFLKTQADRPVASFSKQDVIASIEKRRDRPGSARDFYKNCLRPLFKCACEKAWITSNPTDDVRLPKLGTVDGFRWWSDAEIAQFEARWPVGTKERLAFDLLICTGQRRGDVIRLGRQHIRHADGIDGIFVRQQKTGAEVLIPVLPELAASIAAAPTGDLTFLVNGSGRGYTERDFTRVFSNACKAAGLPSDCTPHGLRKACATRLINAGCEVAEVAAITGHKTLAEVAHYTAKRDQWKLARSAFDKLRAKAA